MALLVFSQSNWPLESWLHRQFPRSRPDAFQGLNSLLNSWAVSLWVCWSALVPAYWILRRYVSVAVLVAAPLLPAMALLLFDFDFADPSWAVLAGVTTIGAFVGVLVGTLLALLPPRWHIAKRPSPSNHGASDTAQSPM